MEECAAGLSEWITRTWSLRVFARSALPRLRFCAPRAPPVNEWSHSAWRRVEMPLCLLTPLDKSRARTKRAAKAVGTRRQRVGRFCFALICAHPTLGQGHFSRPPYTQSYAERTAPERDNWSTHASRVFATFASQQQQLISDEENSFERTLKVRKR